MNEVVRLQERTETLDSNGATAVWNPVETRHAAVIALDAKARARYAELRSDVTHKVVFHGEVTIRVGDHRLLWRDKTLLPAAPAQLVNGNTWLVVREA